MSRKTPLGKDLNDTLRETRELYATYRDFFSPRSINSRRRFKIIEQAFEVGYRHACDDPATRVGFRLGVEAALEKRREKRTINN